MTLSLVEGVPSFHELDDDLLQIEQFLGSNNDEYHPEAWTSSKRPSELDDTPLDEDQQACDDHEEEEQQVEEDGEEEKEGQQCAESPQSRSPIKQEPPVELSPGKTNALHHTSNEEGRDDGDDSGLLPDGSWLDLDEQENEFAASELGPLPTPIGFSNLIKTESSQGTGSNCGCGEECDTGNSSCDRVPFEEEWLTDSEMQQLMRVRTPRFDPLLLSPLITASTPSAHGNGASSAYQHVLGSSSSSSLEPLSLTPCNSSGGVTEHDIPDMVNLFSSMYSPSSGDNHAHNTGRYSPLSIMVPNPQLGQHHYPTGFEMASHGSGSSSQMGSLPTMNPFLTSTSSSSSSRPSATGYEFFTPPSAVNPLLNNVNAASLFLNNDSLSPAPKASNVYSAASTATHSHVKKTAIAPTFTVPIMPLQRSITLEVPLKPKATGTAFHPGLLLHPTSGLLLTSTGNASGLTTSTSNVKVPKLSITPDISDFKLVQIFHGFCDPASKLLNLSKFHQLLLKHQIKEENPLVTNTPPSAEVQSLFRILDSKAIGVIDLEKFMNSFQICNRCTEAKRRAYSAYCASQGQSFVSTALERQLMEDVAPVIVRVVPTAYEGPKVRSCEHYQWTWCEGFEKTGNEKCKGTNRHDKCPKYLANCTLWKHKLPPKNRKAKIFENVESPSKKLKHFA